MDKVKGECPSSAEYEKRVIEVFKELVDYIVNKYYDIAKIKPKKHMVMPKTVQEFNLLFKIFHPIKPHHNQSFARNVRSIDDIRSATILLYTVPCVVERIGVLGLIVSLWYTSVIRKLF